MNSEGMHHKGKNMGPSVAPPTRTKPGAIEPMRRTRGEDWSEGGPCTDQAVRRVGSKVGLVPRSMAIDLI